MFSQVALEVKNTCAYTEEIRDMGFIPGWGRSPGGGNGNPLQYSCLENLMDRGGWWATVHGVQKVRHNWSDTAQQIPQCNRMLSPEIDPYKYSQIIFDKRARLFNEERVFFLISKDRIIGHLNAKINLNTDLPCCCCSVAQSCPTLRPHGVQHTGLPVPQGSVWKGKRPSLHLS